MLSFEEKLNVISAFPELERRNVSLGRVNFHYEGSVYEKKTVVYHLHPNGNGFVYVGQLPGFTGESDDKGFVNIRDYDAEQLRTLVARSIRSLSPGIIEESNEEEGPTEHQLWKGPDEQTLTVYYEDELWYVFAGEILESAFETYEEVEEYMAEEGFILA
ncbi:hypothetical protein RAC89_17500 [Paenibacillus sp. GD4]|uniref:hypothetical protein n=1 Tax=Paenibacillus sp. GD4 TaxID=3068890 RepID=UPI002796AEC9|nr:hypothetical protein [Paenibacillus sp. GD4]MDQ1912185.1 hypothetical protein [Paenibacillus sp. GD4]